MSEEVSKYGPSRGACGKNVSISIAIENLSKFLQAVYSGHEQFGESAEEIAPLTEEQKKAALEELKAKAAIRNAAKAAADKEEQKRNEVRCLAILLSRFTLSVKSSCLFLVV